MPTPDLNSFTLTETWAAADELGVTLTPEQAQSIAFLIVTSKFPVCVREHLREYSRRVDTKTLFG